VERARIGQQKGGAAANDDDVVVSFEGEQGLCKPSQVEPVAHRGPPFRDDGLDRAGDRLVEEGELRDG
jgi:hypothetical protein